MKTVTIKNTPYTYYIEGDDKEVDKAFGISNEESPKLCNILKIVQPEIGMLDSIHGLDANNNETSMGAVVFSPKDEPSLNNHIILMSLEDFESKRFLGTLAHELRHIWQDTYKPEINLVHANGYNESLFHPAEIDADGFAILFLAKYLQLTYEEAASIMCPEEEATNYDAYQLRIEKAKEIDEDLKNQQVQKKKPSLLDKVKKLVGK